MLVEPEDTHERQDEEEAHTKAILDERSGLPMQQCPGSKKKVWQQRPSSTLNWKNRGRQNALFTIDQPSGGWRDIVIVI
jgi:hypothetical protein